MLTRNFLLPVSIFPSLAFWLIASHVPPLVFYNRKACKERQMRNNAWHNTKYRFIFYLWFWYLWGLGNGNVFPRDTGVCLYYWSWLGDQRCLLPNSNYLFLFSELTAIYSVTFAPISNYQQWLIPHRVKMLSIDTQFLLPPYCWLSSVDSLLQCSLCSCIKWDFFFHCARGTEEGADVYTIALCLWQLRSFTV